MLEHLLRRGSFGQFVDQPLGGVHQRLRGGRVGLLHGVHLHLRGGDAWVAGAEADLGLGLLQVFWRVVADVAVLALRLGPALEFAEFVELRVRGEDVVGLVERLQRDLPVAVEVHPLAPLAAHVLQAERVEDLGGREQVVGQRLAVGIHVDPQPAAPGVDAHRRQVGVRRRQRALPVVLLTDVRAGAVQTVCPAVESAYERLAGPALGVLGAFGHVDEPAAAVHAHVVVCRKLVCTGPHDDDRVVEDVVGQVTAHLGQLLDPADLLPDLAPQPIPFRPCIFRRGVGLHPDRRRGGEFFVPRVGDSLNGVGHGFSQLVMAARKLSSLRNSEVLSPPRCVQRRFRPPSTSRVCPVM